MTSRSRKRRRASAGEDYRASPEGETTNKGIRGDDYSSLAYWDKRYGEGVSWEWYCAFDHIHPLFERSIPEWEDSRVLEVGCGDKPLAWDMRSAGHTGKICSFDCSPTVIEQLISKKDSCDRMRVDDGVEFRILDAKELPFEASSFDLVVDKGTVDALMCDGTGTANARATCSEAARVLAPGGWLVVVSHVNPATDEGASLLSEVLLPGMQGSGEAFSWSIDVHCRGEDDAEEGDGPHGQDGDQDEISASEGEDTTNNSSGPSVYMAQKVSRRQTRASTRGQRQKYVTIRIHEY